MKQIRLDCRVVAAVMVSCFVAPIHGADEWSDEFDNFSPDRWTEHTSGLRLVNAPAPGGVEVQNGLLTILEPLRGVRLTSRDRFLYGTLEARVRISPQGLQYVGFMSRSPWGANTVMCMTHNTGNGWDMLLSRDRKGGSAGFGVRTREGEWTIIKIGWQPERMTLDVDGKRIGQVTDRSRIPATPIPLILDTYAQNRLEVDYLRITGTTIVKSASGELPLAPPAGPAETFASDHWALRIDTATRFPTQFTQKFPARLAWTPEGSAAVDVYIRSFDSTDPVRFTQSRDVASLRPAEETRKSPSSMMQPIDDAWRDKVAAELIFDVVDHDMVITVDFTALEELGEPVEIGLGVPFSPDQWERIAIPRLPWLALSPDQPPGVRLPFLADPSDATVTSDTGSWVHYPFGILQNETSSVFWGSMDIGQRIVLAPGNNGSGPAVTLAPMTWAKDETKRLSIRLRAFPRGTTEIVRWYLSNCINSDPLTRDLFPVRDWTPRTLPGGGGLGMPDIRISRVNKTRDPDYFDRVTDMLKKYHVTNLWFGTWHHVNGSYPTSGQWVCPTGLDVSAAELKAEIARLKGLGLRPCLYTYQFITPELTRPETVPSRNWVLHDILGDRYSFDTFKAGDTRHGSEWFTKDVARKFGSDKVTWANVDYGRQEVRDFFFDSITRAIDYYEPSGICFDYGWGVIASNATYSPANPATSQPHGRLRVQADIRKWIKKHHPEMLILINDNPGTPSQLFADCQLIESSDVMSDLDLEAGRALGSAMSSMDYFADHDELRWSRQVMTDLSRGCSIGLPFWIPMNGPDDYVNTWHTFFAFSAKTTALPIVPDSRAITSNVGRSVSGTVWSDDDRLLAAALDHRSAGDQRQTTLRIKLPKGLIETNWRLTRLSKRVQTIEAHGWHIKEQDRSSLTLQGTLRPGELLMVETAP